MFTILDYSSALEYSIIRRYTNIVYYYYIIIIIIIIMDTILACEPSMLAEITIKASEQA